jgi:subtilisin family serine protease
MGSGRLPQLRILSQQAKDSSGMTLTPQIVVGSAELAAAVRGSLVYAGLGKSENFQTVNVKGQIAVIDRGEITFGEKTENAIKAGARGVIVINDRTDDEGIPVIRPDGKLVSIPVVMIDLASGKQLKENLRTGAGSALITVQKTNYSAMSGTSMATPHVSGVVALIRNANRKLTPAQIKLILQKSATKESADVPNGLGAGLINAETAVRLALEAKQ